MQTALLKISTYLFQEVLCNDVLQLKINNFVPQTVITKHKFLFGYALSTTYFFQIAVNLDPPIKKNQSEWGTNKLHTGAQ